jgi:hypothetical protein
VAWGQKLIHIPSRWVQSHLPHTPPLLLSLSKLHCAYPFQEHAYKVKPGRLAFQRSWRGVRCAQKTREAGLEAACCGSWRQIMERCFLISLCSPAHVPHSCDLFSENTLEFDRPLCWPASQLTPFAIQEMIKQVTVFTTRAVKDAFCEGDRQVSNLGQQTAQSADAPGFCTRPCRALGLSTRPLNGVDFCAHPAQSWCIAVDVRCFWSWDSAYVPQSPGPHAQGRLPCPRVAAGAEGSKLRRPSPRPQVPDVLGQRASPGKPACCGAVVKGRHTLCLMYLPSISFLHLEQWDPSWGGGGSRFHFSDRSPLDYQGWVSGHCLALSLLHSCS